MSSVFGSERSGGEGGTPLATSVIMPAYGELMNLTWLLPKVRQALRDAGADPSEVLVVLPGFADEAEIASIESLGGRVVIRQPSNSFGDAIRSGLAAVSQNSRYVVVMDADGSHAPETIVRLLQAPAVMDVVVASRYVSGGSTENSLSLRVMSRALNFAYGLVLGIKCRDVSTNFKRYRAADVRNATLSGRDFDVVEELFLRVKLRHGPDFRILEIPDHFAERKAGETKRRLGPFIVSYLTSLARLRWQAWRHRP